MEQKSGTEVGTKVRNVFITECNYTEETINRMFNYIKELGEKGGFGIVGQETAPTTGTPHYHAYLEFKNPVSLKKLNTQFPKAHFEKRKGTAKQARDYCAKEGSFYEQGEISNQGKRSDLDDVCEAVLAGTSLKEIAKEHPSTYARYERGLKALEASQYEHRTERPVVSWHWGPSGRGKTELAKKHKSHYIKDCSKWWDNYKQEEAIIIDDFDGKWPLRDLLRLLDKNKYQGEFKGGYYPINSPYIYITCEYPPSEFWQENELAQVLSRISKVVHFNGPSNLRTDETKTQFLTYDTENGYRPVGTEVGTEVGGNSITPTSSVPNIYDLDWSKILTSK